MAFAKIEERLEKLLAKTVLFRRAIITCRTQFFPKASFENEERGYVDLEHYRRPLRYLSLFNDDQVKQFLITLHSSEQAELLRKIFRRAKKTNPQVAQDKELVSQMGTLRMRPMLLQYIDDLRALRPEERTQYRIYETLVDQWLRREGRKEGVAISKKALRTACRAIALDLQRRGEHLLTEAQLNKILKSSDIANLIKTLDVGGRSLLNRTSDGSYRFAHYTIQEFLVCEALLQDKEEEGKKIKITAEIGWFARTWVEEAPAQRTGKAMEKRWMLLRLLGVANLRQANLRGANLIGVDLREADLREANLSGAYLIGAIFIRAIFSGSDLRKTDFSGANLRGTNLRGANLSEANLRGTLFVGADLSGANLYQARNLTQTQLDTARGDANTKLPQDLSHPNHWLMDLSNALS